MTDAAPPAGGTDRAATELAQSLPLAWLVAVAAIGDLVWNHVAVLALPGEDETQRWLVREGAIWRNLGAVAGLAAITVGFWTYFRMAGFATPLRRVQVAALSGLFLPAILLSAVGEPAELGALVVLVAVGVGNALVVLLGITGGVYLASPYRAGVWGAAITSVLVLALLVGFSFESLGILGNEDGTPSKLSVAMVACLVGAELVWLFAPLLVVRALVRVERPTRAGWAIVLATLVTVAVATAAGLHARLDLDLVAYGAFRVTLLPDWLVWPYAVPIGITLAAGIAALALGPPRVRQVGIYLVLWVAAGFSPRTPIQMVYLVVTAISIARAVQASDPEGQRRAELAWGEPIVPPAEPPARSSDAPSA